MPEVLCIEGGNRLEGQVAVSGAKNAALPLLFATLLSSGTCRLSNVPDLEDISVSMRLLRSLGAQCSFENNVLTTAISEVKGTEAPYGLVKSLRASFWALGPLVARVGEARVSLPGGDAIGTRPVDLHLKGLRQFGVDFRMKHGVVIATAPGPLHGADITLDYPSVGATHNLLMAASLIPHESIIRGAAREPEVVALADFIRKMGADIEGESTGTIKIQGRQELDGAEHEVLGDRIEASTYLLCAAITAGKIALTGIDPQVMDSTLSLLRDIGCVISIDGGEIVLEGPQRITATDFETAPSPGIATDVQPLFLAALCAASGTSRVTETVFENRFGHVAEYRRFGADISVEGRVATVKGVERLSAAPVEAFDIRAAAGLVLLALRAEGVTQISELHHLDRGYDGMTRKLAAIGASVSRLPLFESKEEIVGC